MSQFRHEVIPEEDVAHVIDHTVDLYGAPTIAATPQPLAETNATLRRSLDITTRPTAPFGACGR